MWRPVSAPATASLLLSLAVLACCGLFAANSLVRTRAFSADSMNYVDVARRIAAGEGIVQSTGGFNQPFFLSGDLDLPTAFTAQPPAYPLTIAALARLGIDAADAALVVSALAYTAILGLVYVLGRRVGGAGAGAVGLGAALVFVPLTHLGRMALSECLAVALVLLFFLLLHRLLVRPLICSAGQGFARPAERAVLAALGLGLVAGLAFSVRYALWPLPLVGAAALLGCGKFGRRLGTLAGFAVGALLPAAAVLARNRALDGALFPAAMPAVRTFGENLDLAATALLGGWRSTALGNWSDAAVLLVLLSVLAVLAARSTGGRHGRPATGGRARAGDAGKGAAAPETAASFRTSSPAWRGLPVLACVWAVLYLATVVWRSSLVNFDPIGARLALPATVPLLPVFGALVAQALPRARRLAWLPAAILALCVGAALAREAALWWSGRDARALEFRSERQQWLRENTGPGDLVIGGGTMDVPFLFPGRFAISYAGLPYTEVLTWPDLERIADRHCPDFERLLLVVRPTVLLGGGRSDQDPSDWLGAFIADVRAGQHEAYPLLQPLADLAESRVYRVSCR